MATTNSRFQRRYPAEMRVRAVCMSRQAIAESGERVGAVSHVARQRGIASTALRLLSRWAFEHLAVARLELWVEPWNTASQRVAERAGFQREGVLHSYIEVEKTRRDVIMYARIATTFPAQKESQETDFSH